MKKKLLAVILSVVMLTALLVPVLAASAAAPTAGLHFTDEIFKKLEDKGVEVLDVTLHVGLGTFRPVSEENVLEHKMHSE